MESKFKFDNKYPIPDLKYPILESESIFDSQPYAAEIFVQQNVHNTTTKIMKKNI